MSQPPKRHLDRFSRFCIVRPTHKHTTTLRVTSVAIGLIYAMHAVPPKNRVERIRSNTNTFKDHQHVVNNSTSV